MRKATMMLCILSLVVLGSAPNAAANSPPPPCDLGSDTVKCYGAWANEEVQWVIDQVDQACLYGAPPCLLWPPWW